ncbi:MAG: glutamate--tRNA ligase [Cyclobacteriaceae bacterium]
MDNVRVRFAPSPTGGLHIGGVRTALFNYLFAKHNKGTFILRIEDTDQNRFVEGAEEYILNALKWCGITPDESIEVGGEYGPYRQSERKEMYKEYADKLIESGNAYYAFDTPEDLDAMRGKLKEAGLTNPQYDSSVRMTMKNSLTLPAEEVQSKIEAGEPYVIRVKIPPKDDVRFNDMIRSWVMVNGATLDDKVLMKSDGMPTYHLANVVDDHLMKISHVIRGEEWLPSTPLHVLLYRFLGWEDTMPKFAHLPLILKPDGNGKLSKRAADKAGFPIFPLSWTTPDGDLAVGFKEEGFLPEAMINFLSFLGWNPGTEQEIFSLDELVEHFTLERVNKAGTKFDIEKARWFNQQYLKSADPKKISSTIIADLKEKHQIDCSADLAADIFHLLKERVTYPHEMADSCLFLFQNPATYDEKVVRKKWNEEAVKAVTLYGSALAEKETVSPEEAKELFFSLMEANDIGAGKNMQALRLSITGEGSGPDLMTIISIMGGNAVNNRINYSVGVLGN